MSAIQRAYKAELDLNDEQVIPVSTDRLSYGEASSEPARGNRRQRYKGRRN